jgi:hypothetical protein
MRLISVLCSLLLVGCEGGELAPCDDTPTCGVCAFVPSEVVAIGLPASSSSVFVEEILADREGKGRHPQKGLRLR